LHHALQRHVGSHAQQQGSKVEDDWLRFDFTNLAPVDAEHLAAIEQDVNEKVAAKAPIRWQYLPIAEARKAGAMMLFGEKYPETVRMVSMGDFSKELCGGIHLDNTSEVGPFEIVSEEGVSAGTRRITALTGEKAKENAARTIAALELTAKKLGVGPLDVPVAVKHVAQNLRDLKKQLASGAKPSEVLGIKTVPVKPVSGAPTYADQKAALKEAARTLNVSLFDVPARVGAALAEIEDLKKQLAAQSQSGEISADSLLNSAQEIAGAKVIVAETPGANPNLMRQWIDQLRKKGGSLAVLLAAGQGEDKVTLVAGVTRDLVEKGVSAGNWVRDVAPVVGGGGGGKPDMAQAGGKSPDKLPEALEAARQVIKTMLA
jgi:alanyl-tRNA synthetase